MALQAKAIQQKMKSVGNIRKITKTMEMISVSKMRRAVEKAQASKSYTMAVFSLISYISRQEGVKESSPLFLLRATGKTLAIVISSNKGLCGAYNLNIHKKLSVIKKEYGGGIDCITVGRHAEKSAARLSLPIIASFVSISEKDVASDIRIASTIAIEKFNSADYREIVIIYTEFTKALQFTASVKKLLPFDEGIVGNMLFETDLAKKQELNQSKTGLAAYVFEPGKAYILETMLPKLIQSIIYQAFLESLASEHSSRMLAMKTASDSASEIFKDLKLSFNHARQDAITRELSEIVSGAATLQAD